MRAVKATYENGNFLMKETPPLDKSEVIVIFLDAPPILEENRLVFDELSISTKNFKFNREEANER